MKKVYTAFLFLFALNTALFATHQPGFIVTKDAKIITGRVAEIFYSTWKTELVFINEMGRRYTFHPAVIKGFAINNNGSIVEFESKYQKGTWRFLEVLEKGKTVSLYRSPMNKTQEVSINYGDNRIINRKVREYWLENGKSAPIRVNSMNYKKLLRFCLSKQPEIVEKIGKTGYRFRDIQDIIKEYNRLIAQNAKRI